MTDRPAGIDAFVLRKVAFRGEGQGKAFKAPDGKVYGVTVAQVEGAPHVMRVSIAGAGKDGVNLGYEDVHFAPEQDLEALLMKNIRKRLFAVEATTAVAAAGETFIAGWGKPAGKKAAR